MYRGQVIFSGESAVILAHHEPCTDGIEASKYILVEGEAPKKAFFTEDLGEFKLACHQNYYCLCKSFASDEPPCPGTTGGVYTGPVFTSDELYSLSYVDLSEDIRDGEASLPIHYSYIGSACEDLRKNPELVNECVSAIQQCGNKFDRRARRIAARMGRSVSVGSDTIGRFL